MSIYNKFYFVKKVDFIRIINEEISEFDFLGNEQQQEEDKELALLNNVDFQKQFICDFLLDKKNKYKITNVVESNLNDWRQDGYLNINYIVEILYQYDTTKKSAKFGLWFKGEHVGYGLDGRHSPGDRWTAPLNEDWFNEIDWDNVDVQMFMIDERDDEIKFIAFENAPERIRNLFISHFTVALACSSSILRLFLTPSSTQYTHAKLQS